MKTTNKHVNYWEKREIDWEKDYLATWNHPHRGLITTILKNIGWFSLWEIGVGGGANLKRIAEEIPGRQLGGNDVSEDAIKLCSEKFIGGMFRVERGDDLFMSDQSIDVMLSDMCLIYVGPRDIHKYIKEMKRVTRNYVILCEFHSDSIWDRFKARLTGHYNVYDYKKLLQKHGFHSIMIQHIPEQYWPGADNNSKFRTIIMASI